VGVGGVVPVVTTGLHCGGRPDEGRSPVDPSSPSSRRGSIAASRFRGGCHASADRRPRRHDGAPLRRGECGLGFGEKGRRPRRHDGAPLRRYRSVPRRSSSAPVVPVVTTGLHCGWDNLNADRPPRLVVPVVTTGLHCGRGISRGRPARSRVVPVVTTGLHCGQRRVAPSLIIAAGRPRRHDGAPLRRGSWSRCRGWTSRRPRRHDGAPLRLGLLGPAVGVRHGSRPRRHDGAPLRPRAPFAPSPPS